MPNNRQKRQRREMVSAGTWAANNGSDRPSLKLPDGVSYFEGKPGTYTVSILAYVVSKTAGKRYASHNIAGPGKWYFTRTYFTHPKVGVNGDTVVCPAKTFNEKCPLCEARVKLERDLGPKLDRKNNAEWKALLPKERQLFLIHVKEQPEKGIQLFEVSNFAFGKQLATKINTPRDNKDEIDAFYDPDNGYDLRVVGTEEKGDGFSWTKFGVDDFIKRKKPLPDELVEHGICLDDLPQTLAYKDLKKKWLVEDEVADTDEEESDEDSEEEDDDEVEDDTDFVISKGMEVEFTYRGKNRTGKVVKITKDDDGGNMAAIECEDREKPYNIPFDDVLGPAEQEDDDDEVDDGDTEEDDDDDRPTPAKGRNGKPRGGPTRGRADEEDDEDADDEEDEEEDGEDDEEVAPRGRGKPTKSSRKPVAEDVDDEDEDEDEDDPLEDDDEEEEEKPKVRGKKPPPRRR